MRKLLGLAAPDRGRFGKHKPASYLDYIFIRLLIQIQSFPDDNPAVRVRRGEKRFVVAEADVQYRTAVALQLDQFSRIQRLVLGLTKEVQIRIEEHLAVLAAGDQSSVVAFAGQRTEDALDEQRLILVLDHQSVLQSELHLGVDSEDHQLIQTGIHENELALRLVVVHVVLDRQAGDGRVLCANAFRQSAQATGRQVERIGTDEALAVADPNDFACGFGME